MAASVNKVILVGNLGKDPEIRSFQNGGRVASFSIATSESWKDKRTGEKTERIEWHRISVLNDTLVGVIERYLKKGAKVYVEGQLETRKWTDKDGHDKFSTEVVLRPYRGELTMLESGVHNSGVSADNRQTGQPRAQAQVADLNDEIPF